MRYSTEGTTSRASDFACNVQIVPRVHGLSMILHTEDDASSARDAPPPEMSVRAGVVAALTIRSFHSWGEGLFVFVSPCADTG